MPLAERPKLVLERYPLAVLGGVDIVDKHFGERFRHAFGLFVRAAPLGLAGFEAASDPRRAPPWAGLGVSLRDGPQKRRGPVAATVFTSPERGKPLALA